METTVFVLFCDSSRQVKSKISQQVQVKTRSVLVQLTFIYPAYLGMIQHIGTIPTDFIVLAEAQRPSSPEPTFGTFCEQLKKKNK